MNAELNRLFKELLARPYDDRYGVGMQFFFNLRHLERLADKHFIADNRGPEHGIEQLGGFNTVPDLDFEEFETYIWNKIKPTIERNNVTFISSCIALTYKPKYHKVNYHIHREGLRKINPSPYNYTFFFCDNPDANVNFNVMDEVITFDEIVNNKLVNYETSAAINAFVLNKPIVEYKMRHGDVMRFDATAIAHGANENFEGDEIGAFLVLNGCYDPLEYKPHTQYKNEF